MNHYHVPKQELEITKAKYPVVYTIFTFDVYKSKTKAKRKKNSSDALSLIIALVPLAKVLKISKYILYAHGYLLFQRFEVKKKFPGKSNFCNRDHESIQHFHGMCHI